MERKMPLRIPYWVPFGAVTIVSAAVTAAVLNVAAAFAADISAESLKLATGVAKAPGYETPDTQYIVANPTSIYSDHYNPTSIYSDHYFTGTKVTGELKRGDHVQALAKVKGWDWVLVGKGGTGIGYVATSMLSPADKYIP
jgi:hypothetical protein